MLRERVNLELDTQQTKFTDSELPEQLKVWIVQTHTDIPINNRLYRRDEVSKQVQSYVKPYFKPVLLHHDDHADPIGRVVEAHYIPRERFEVETKKLVGKPIALPQDQTGAVLLKAYITDKTGIQKILSGLYTTVSIGFTADELRCSICNKRIDFLSLAFGQDPEEEDVCTHKIGHEYDGQIQYAVPYGISYNEISFVNIPADAYAGIAKVSVQSLDEAINAIGIGVEKDDNETLKDSAAVVFADSAGNNITDSTTRAKEAEAMELEAIKQELESVKKELADLKAENEKLRAIADEYKARLIGELVELKAMVAGLTDEEIESLKTEYAKQDLATIKLLLTDFASIVDKIIDAETADEELADSEDEEAAVNANTSETVAQGQVATNESAVQSAETVEKKEDSKVCAEDAKEEKVEIKRDQGESKTEKKFVDISDPIAIVDQFLKGQLK